MSIGPTVDWQPPESSQPRHLTVTCDVVVTTHLSDERDVEARFSTLHAHYSECRLVVERHGGRIAQHQGGGIAAYPELHEAQALLAQAS